MKFPSYWKLFGLFIAWFAWSILWDAAERGSSWFVMLGTFMLMVGFPLIVIMSIAIATSEVDVTGLKRAWKWLRTPHGSE